MTRCTLPNVPFVEAHNQGTNQSPTAIFVTISSTTSDKGAALGVANWHHSPIAPTVSYHYVVDEGETYRCVPDHVASYGNPYKAINVHICAQPQDFVEAWSVGTAKPALERAAELVADLIVAHKIRLRYLDLEAEHRWLKHRWRHNGGIRVRVPGSWPSEDFLNLVKAQVAVKKAR